MSATSYFCEWAWLGGDEPARDVLIDVAGDHITSVRATGADAASDPGDGAPPGRGVAEAAVRLPGLTVPGLANAHSHVFHRAIRGHTQSGAADFWAWRDLMYGVAGRLDPDSLYALARATYAEMALSGITAVGEFHYLHHDPAGRTYDDPNLLGRTVVQAAKDAGLRITLLDTCYLTADVDGKPLTGVQQRFDDGSAGEWAERVALLADDDFFRVGAAIHSVRAVPREAMRVVGDVAAARRLPLHVHLSEQPAENAACQRVHGMSPTALLDAEGVLGPRTTAVHATHLDDNDIALLGGSGTSICMCPTTERDLADGVGPAVRLAASGSPLCVGSDAHMMIDLWEEARAIELDERLVTGKRGHLPAADLMQAATSAGMAALGWDAGRLEPGALADLVTVRLDTPRTAGATAGNPLPHVVFSATAADVSHVIVGGRVVVEDGRHRAVPDVGPALEAAIATVLV